MELEYNGPGAGGGSSSLVVGVTPVTGGSDMEVFFNDGGVLQSDPGLKFDKISGVLGVLVGVVMGDLAYPSADATAGYVMTTDGLGTLSLQAPSGTPAGSDTQVQFNDGGIAFGADAAFTFDKASGYLSVNSIVSHGGTNLFVTGFTDNNTSSTSGNATFQGGSTGGTGATAGNAYLLGGDTSGGSGQTAGNVYVIGGSHPGGGSGSTAGNVYIALGSGADTNGHVFINSMRFPDADGTAGYTLTTNGSNVLSFQPPTVPSLTATQIGFGDGSNLLTSSANLTWDGTTFLVSSPGSGGVLGIANFLQPNASGPVEINCFTGQSLSTGNAISAGFHYNSNNDAGNFGWYAMYGDAPGAALSFKLGGYTGVGGAPSGSYNFEVTGTEYVSGVLTGGTRVDAPLFNTGILATSPVGAPGNQGTHGAGEKLRLANDSSGGSYGVVDVQEGMQYLSGTATMQYWHKHVMNGYNAQYAWYPYNGATVSATPVMAAGTNGATPASTGYAAGINTLNPGFEWDVQGMINTPGTSNNTYRWNANTSAPTPQALVTLPLNVYGQGTITDLLGDPDAWVLVNIGGTHYKLPAYL